MVRSGGASRLGGPGWLPTQGSRRSGRARLTHPVPLATDSLPKGIRSAIRWCYVDTGPGRQCIRGVSFQRDHDQASRFPPRGPSGFPFPRFDGTIKTLRLPAALPPALRCLRLAVPPRHARFAPGSMACDAAGQGFLRSAPVTPFRIKGGDDRASHVPGEPQLCLCPALRPRRDRRVRPSRRVDAAPVRTTAKAPACNLSFGAQSHGLSTHCLRFAAPVARTPRKTRFRLLASSTGRVWLPAGFHRKVSECYSSMAIILLSQAFVA